MKELSNNASYDYGPEATRHKSYGFFGTFGLAGLMAKEPAQLDVNGLTVSRIENTSEKYGALMLYQSVDTYKRASYVLRQKINEEPTRCITIYRQRIVE